MVAASTTCTSPLSARDRVVSRRTDQDVRPDLSGAEPEQTQALGRWIVDARLWIGADHEGRAAGDVVSQRLHRSADEHCGMTCHRDDGVAESRDLAGGAFQRPHQRQSDGRSRKRQEHDQSDDSGIHAQHQSLPS